MNRPGVNPRQANNAETHAGRKTVADTGALASFGATIYHAMGVPLDLRLGRDGVSRPITTGQPILDLFG